MSDERRFYSHEQVAVKKLSDEVDDLRNQFITLEEQHKAQQEKKVAFVSALACE